MVLDEAEHVEAFWGGVPIGTYRGEGEVWECVQIDSVYVEYRIESGRFYRDMKCHRNPDLIMKYIEDKPLDVL